MEIFKVSEICFLFQHNYLLGKKTRTAKKKKSNKLFNGEAHGWGSWTQTGQVEEVRAQTRVRKRLYKFVARDSQVNGRGVRMMESPDRRVADRSFYVAGVGRL